MTRTILIGDIHGCLDEFDELLATVEFRANVDRLVLLGDLVDRGPDPLGVVRRARELRAESVLGNHEEKHLRYRRHELRRTTFPEGQRPKNPMKPMTGERLAQHLSFSEDDWAWIEKLPITIRLDDDWIAVHAGFEPCLPMDKQRADKQLRVRYVDSAGKMKAILNDTDQPGGTFQWATRWMEPLHVAYGHHALSMATPIVHRHAGTFDDPWIWYRVALDTACCFGGSLSALILPLTGHPENCTVSVKARATYAHPWANDSA